ncbi:hypothetical protein F383_12055 [Gossypium arboreum]|uniref:Uncharacterized protein n=1 Tax=Gossypium arboreum TaxID=29729 RepID=A0A0B0PXM2_GOSAR|nr:hypothetical protein F383_12055 [Gossypium arboreum]
MPIYSATGRTYTSTRIT